MDDKFLCGIILGMLGGAVLVTNSVKARQVVKDSQAQVLQKVEQATKTAKKNSQETANN